MDRRDATTMRSIVRRRGSQMLVGAIVALGLAGAFYALRGRGLRQGTIWRIRAMLDAPRVRAYAHGNFTSLIFLHHSVGRNMIEQGRVRESFTQAGFDFWDHDYNPIGLTRPDGSRAGYAYSIPGDNTDPDGLAAIFSQPEFPLPVNAFSGLLQHEVIIFKSCFPVSNIRHEEQLLALEGRYLVVRDAMAERPDKILILLTPPPLNPAATDREAAARARRLANWLQSDAFLLGHPNVFVFDLFGLLAEANPGAPDHNMLRRAYRDGTDSHPNQFANEAIAPIFVESVLGMIDDYKGGASGQGE